MVVGKIGALNHLVNERPEFERLVRSLVVENKVDAAHTFIFADKVEPPQKLLRNGERSLPNLRHAHLRQNPFQYVRHLHGIGKIRLAGRIFQRTENFIYVCGTFHFFAMALGLAAFLDVGAEATKWSYSSQLACIFLSSSMSSLRNG